MTPRAGQDVARASEALGRARRALERARGSGPESDRGLVLELAEALWDAGRQLETPGERRQRLRMARLVSDPPTQRFAVALTDRVSRRPAPSRLVAAVGRLVESVGVPDTLEGWQRLGLAALPLLGEIAPPWAAFAVEQAVTHEASAYVVRGQQELRALLERQAAEELGVNLNHLGEEVVGEEQALLHVERYQELARRADVSALSVKVSALYSQASLFAFDESLALLAERLRAIYRAALGAPRPRIVYLDMESYRDVELTLTLFMRLLDEDELMTLRAGVVLQAYLPESVAWQRRLIEWATRRRAAGGAPVRLRLVKGANLNLERVESSLRGWPLPVLPTKDSVDAQFKHMLRVGCAPEALDAVHLGVGSHNLFDIAYALLARERSGAPEHIQIEMLHGMAEPLRRAVRAVSGQVLVYVPAVDPQDFPSAVAYLVRRFDENAAEENFLRHGFGMETGDALFSAQRLRFERSLVSYTERGTLRTPQRGLPRSDEPKARPATFVNEPDTDPSRPSDRAFLRECLVPVAPVVDVPLSIGGDERLEGPARPGFDPSRPGVVPYEFRTATAQQVEEALREAQQAARCWAAVSPRERVSVVRAAASALRASRQELIRALVLDGAKRVEEADAEVSEAIDFAEYYAACFEELSGEYETRARGVVLVTPPWNFPLAIPLGGVLAALVAGNAVLLKPAPETPLVAYLGARALWRGGVPREVLQFVPCDESVASRLVVDRRVDAVVLTGATDTARLFRRLRPGIRLFAETGGKNALVVSSVCDRELAIRDAMRSAFGHAGQKCSALSLLIVERDLYEDPDFRRQLRDAAASLTVGSAWDPRSMVTPLINAPTGALARGLQLEAGEEWLLAPQTSEANPRLVSPGVKLGVSEESHAYRTELFGPVLAVLAAEDLEHALRLANGTAYGLTAGFHGLDEREQAFFIEHMRAGNLYVNRTITGAIVGRQPFGGQKASGFGPGAKAGGPNYVRQFCSLSRRRGPAPRGAPSRRGDGALELAHPTLSQVDLRQLNARLDDYRRTLGTLAPARRLQPELLGEDNWFRYLACRVAVVLGPDARPLDVATLLGIDQMLGGRLDFFVLDAGGRAWLERLVLARGAQRVGELEEVIARGGTPSRIRIVGVDPERAWRAFGATDAHIETEPVSEFGCVELVRYLVEQSVSMCVHRHGNLGLSALAPRPRGLCPSEAEKSAAFSRGARRRY